MLIFIYFLSLGLRKMKGVVTGYVIIVIVIGKVGPPCVYRPGARMLGGAFFMQGRNCPISSFLCLYSAF